MYTQPLQFGGDEDSFEKLESQIADNQYDFESMTFHNLEKGTPCSKLMETPYSKQSDNFTSNTTGYGMTGGLPSHAKG